MTLLCAVQQVHMYNKGIKYRAVVEVACKKEATRKAMQKADEEEDSDHDQSVVSEG